MSIFDHYAYNHGVTWLGLNQVKPGRTLLKSHNLKILNLVKT